jgi:hypothetical protein
MRNEKGNTKELKMKNGIQNLLRVIFRPLSTLLTQSTIHFLPPIPTSIPGQLVNLLTCQLSFSFLRSSLLIFHFKKKGLIAQPLVT